MKLNVIIKSNRNILECTNVSKQFGTFFALKKISFIVKKNIIFGIVGANGAGKTTLIKILSGLLKPTLGRILISGKNYEDHPKKIKKVIGTITDESFLDDGLTIYENLKFYDNLHFNFEKNKILSKIERYTKLFNLIDWCNESIRILSRGMKKKVELIRVLMHHPSILFLDEPFSGLDFNTIKILKKLFIELKEKENVSIILTTHKIEDAMQMCDELMILKSGKISKQFSRENFNEIEIETYF